jgi:hypothetical protein
MTNNLYVKPDIRYRFPASLDTVSGRISLQFKKNVNNVVIIRDLNKCWLRPLLVLLLMWSVEWLQSDESGAVQIFLRLLYLQGNESITGTSKLTVLPVLSYTTRR